VAAASAASILNRLRPMENCGVSTTAQAMVAAGADAPADADAVAAQALMPVS